MNYLERNSNFELLRIIAMVMIVTMHVLDESGIFISEKLNTFNFIISNVINGFSIVAVNCYILISGHFGYRQLFKKEKLVKLYSQVIFISIFISSVFWILKIESMNIKNIVTTFMPIISQTWWFISVFFALYVIAPYVNILIEVIDKKQLERLILISLIIFVIWPSLSISDLIKPINDDGGYGLYNFILLYIIGGYIGKYRKNIKINKYLFINIYIVSMVLLIGINLILTYLTNGYIAKLSYDFILIYIGSISLFLYFKEISIQSKFINLASSLTLGVYLIHEHPFIRNLISKTMKDFKLCSSNNFIIYLPIIVCGIYITTSLLELIRSKVFEIIVKLKGKMCNKNK